ncbi:hypothetical protein QBC46DRAFT_4892 [Diplogelasinospora grovesii]|uniref:Protein prenyltransferase n=1 Tax=Diplogelasinospora grovesii TaxID=303347 RepID=A0AAN6SB10_9PEZI|nr:hypothetical protein QBC46DRAFT_4892 [Diplogelasinospora grovesii]
MSRALDKDTATALKNGNSKAAYEAISQALLSSASPNDDLLDIEILGKAFPFQDGTYVLQEGVAIGASKLGLVQAFFVARQVLTKHIDGTSPRTDDEMLAATAVMLLLDPEHLTAANARKRILQRQLHGHDQEKSQLALNKEKHFIDSFLTSRLHRHTKSPTLWSHRRWLMTVYTSLGIPVDVPGDIVKVILVAGERHPRNYYAWCHARFLMGLGRRSSENSRILAAVKNWCFGHHTDISGWSFLHFLFLHQARAPSEAAETAFAEVLEFADSLRLANESVWVFLRAMAASGLVGDDGYSQFFTTGQHLLATSKRTEDLAVLRSAMEWCETFRTKT